MFPELIRHTRVMEIVGDTELFARSRPDAAIVAVTGTNGKSTCVRSGTRLRLILAATQRLPMSV